MRTVKTNEPYDIFIIGGGINGCGVARDAAGRGFSVCLAEKDDLAGATSSGSTKLIHGGLRYLEYYEFNLVRKALMEREVLWRIAPHIIYPLRFVLPHHDGLRPAWLLRLGLFLYDHLGGRELLPGTRTVDMTRDEIGEPLKPLYKKGFEYSDCWVDDARLVVLNARDAANHGAHILTRTKVTSARREKGLWSVSTQSSEGTKQTHYAKALINAAGPWVDRLLHEVVGQKSAAKIRLVRGGHIVVPKIFEHDRCYIFQNTDGRIVFAIPYEEEFTLLGTTDRDHDSDAGKAKISDEEIAYLCESANKYFNKVLTPADVVWTYSAVRPLFDDGKTEAQAATRDYNLQTEGGNGQAPLINVFGGKITTYRKLAESVMAEVARYLSPRGPSWTATAPLPGGEFPVHGYTQLVSDLARDYPFLSSRHARRLIRLYGTLARKILGDAKNYDDLGRCFGSDLFETEIRYQIEREWVLRAEDVLWRRTKEGLRVSDEEVQELDRFLMKPSLHERKYA